MSAGRSILLRHGQSVFDEGVAGGDALPPAVVREHLTVGAGDSLAQVVRRVAPSWHEVLRPAVARGDTVLVVAHDSSLRALCCLVEQLDEAGVGELSIPSVQPLVDGLDRSGRAVPPGGDHLDGPAARAAVLALAAEGGT